ncbi:MAG: TolC family protein, partial [Syntrophales bacterium]|nr:TolC family protein [Syntrophales bacterium]
MKKQHPLAFIAIFLFYMLTVSCGNALAEEYGLNDLYRIALEKSEKIKYSEQNRFIAEEGKNKKLSVLMPRLSAYGSYTDFTESKKSDDIVLNRNPLLVFPGTVIQPDYMGQWGVRLDQAITIDGKEYKDFKISKDNIAKQEKDIFAVKEDYMMTVATNYYEVLRSKKALDIADATVE